MTNAPNQFNNKDGVTLKEHLLEKIIALEKEMDRRIKSLEKTQETVYSMSQDAIDKAEKVINARLESQNEWRDQNKDILNLLATKASLSALADRINKLEKKWVFVEGKASQTSVLVFGGITVITFVITMVQLFM